MEMNLILPINYIMFQFLVSSCLPVKAIKWYF